MLVTHDQAVRLLSDLLKALVSFIVERVKIIDWKVLHTQFFFLGLDLLPKVVSNDRPDLLVHEQILVSSQVLWNVITEAEVLNSLPHEQVVV